MSYKMEKPYTEKAKADFIVEYNHKRSLLIEETDTAIYALEPDEIMQDGEPVKNVNYETEQLEKLKEKKISEINTAKEAAFKDGIIFNSNHFDCDDRAQDRTGNRLLLLQAMPVETLEWLDYDYKPVEMTALDFQQLCSAIFERVQFIEFRTGTLFDSVNNALTSEELNALIIDFGQEEVPQENGEEEENGI